MLEKNINTKVTHYKVPKNDSNDVQHVIGKMYIA